MKRKSNQPQVKKIYFNITLTDSIATDLHIEGKQQHNELIHIYENLVHKTNTYTVRLSLKTINHNNQLFRFQAPTHHKNIGNQAQNIQTFSYQLMNAICNKKSFWQKYLVLSVFILNNNTHIRLNIHAVWPLGGGVGELLQ